MGTGSSFQRGHDEDDVLGEEYSSSQGVIKRIPIEVKPRGRLGLRSVRSLGKPKGGSLRSALSIDLENPEVEKIRKDFEMYRLNKENEHANNQKKVQKLETENKRLRAELQTLQKMCHKLRDERDAAIEAEHQALVRAAAFESDRDKIQRQFKIFRETKESELQNLLKARRDLESKLFKVAGHGILDDTESTSKVDASIVGSNPGDWWTALESEPSMGSTTQLHIPVSYRGPELGHTLLEMEGPYLNVNKDDWTAAAASLATIFPAIPESLQTNIIRVFISSPSDTLEERDIFMQEYGPKLSRLCKTEGHFYLPVYMPCQEGDNFAEQERYIHARCHQIDQSSIFLAFLADQTELYTQNDYNLGYVKNPGTKTAIFCFRPSRRDKELPAEVSNLRKQVKESAGAKIIEDYTSPLEAAEQVFIEMEKIIKFELGVDTKEADSGEKLLELDGPSALCGGCLWDINLDYEQMESLTFAGRSTCELGFEKYYDRLSAHVAAPGPLPPLLVSGPAGSGRSLLLAKWIGLQQHKASNMIILYHFVGSPSSCSAEPLIMIRRLTQQLMQQVTSPPALTCDPLRLVEEFPKWLERVSSKTPGGVVLVLDSIDRLQNAESHLKWLLDPLPVDTRVIISVQDNTCPSSWKFWPVVHLEELSNKNIKELLHAELASLGKSMSQDEEMRLLTHCRTPATSYPLYVILIATDIARCNSDEVITHIDSFLETKDAVEVFKKLLYNIRTEYECDGCKGLLKNVLHLILASRNGVSESELMYLCPDITWNNWAPLCDALLDRYILTYRSGLLVFAHQQGREAAMEMFITDSDGSQLRAAREKLIRFFCDNKMGRCGELIALWQYIGMERSAMAMVYYDACKNMEAMVGQSSDPVMLTRVADVYEALGRYLRDLAMLNEALMPLQRALEIREATLDPDHPSVAQSLHQVAGIHAQQSKFTTAELLYKQAMEIYEGAFGKDHFLVAKELEALSVLYQKQGKHKLAESLRKRAINIRKHSRIPRVTCGYIHGADVLKKRVLQLEQLTVGPNSADLARTLNEIGVLYYLQNNIEVAESLFKKCLEMREAVLGPDSDEVAQSLNNLAALYNDKKQFEKAEPLYMRAVEIRRKLYSDNHPSVAAVEKHLAMLYKKMNQLSKAEPLYKHAVNVRESSFGTNHPSVATALVNLAVLYSQQGKYALAEPLYERALKIYEESFGTSHSRVAETLRNLARLKYDMDEFEVAASLYKRATEIRENGATYPNKATSPRTCTCDESFMLNRNQMM
ncbi:hypothetical protein LSH36_575g02042 [Paralvinella palmiformis]|uniref:Nephrocystin-3 n=1 Tax=Paralvinella palmiformis TaxID=53620 RepID=A0AAD9J5S9_9ANNE|nr:hypothetical protein LSH36_575g02042 [Paralvinella palmiformis]